MLQMIGVEYFLQGFPINRQLYSVLLFYSYSRSKSSEPRSLIMMCHVA